jgi:hypothetical protein
VYSNQTAFNHVWKTFVVDEAPQSKSPHEPACSYGEPSTTGCAIACLLTPALRSRAWEIEQAGKSLGVSALCRHEPDIATYLQHVELPLLRGLQHAHDTPYDRTKRFSDVMRKRLTEVAVEHDLVAPKNFVE